MSLAIYLIHLFLLFDFFSLSSTSPNPPPVFGFWHISTVSSYMEIVADQLSQLQNSSFTTDITFVRILSTNPNRTDVESLISSHPATEKLGLLLFTYGTESEGVEFADTKSTHLVRKFSEYLLNEDAILWFIHNKGVTHFGTPLFEAMSDWRRMMMYFLFEKDWCYLALKEDFYDTCGSNIRSDPFRHYSGTFWMAHSRYVRTLPYADKFWEGGFGPRNSGEFWLLHSDLPHMRSLCVHESKINHYKDGAYPPSEYIDAAIGWGCEENTVKEEFVAFLDARTSDPMTSMRARLLVL